MNKFTCIKSLNCLNKENNVANSDWALWQSDGEKKLRILELIDSARRCTMKQSGRDALAEKTFSRNIGGRASLSTLFKRKLPVKGGKNGKQEVDMGELVKNIHAMGFGKMYFGNGMKAAAISTIPYIEASDLSPDRHHPTYTSGSYTEMSSKLWLHTRVTVRSLLEPPPPGALVDILISELEALCKLTHPQILLLMGVCQTKNYEGLMLVFEHVQLGSLYFCLHEKNCMPKIKSAVDILLQIVDALIYLHSHGWLHCSLTSHAVHLVGPSVAKLSSFELAVEDKEETRRNRTLNLLADKGWQSIYNWLCPDILRGEPPSKCGDLYSLCCLIWEICTGQVPWGNLDPDEILIEIKLKGHSLPLDKKYIPKHLLTVLEQGLKLRRDERDVNLHEIRDMLILTRKNAVKSEKKEHPRPSGGISHRNSSTTDSGVWFGSGSQPVRSYSSSAIQRSPVSSHSSQSYHHHSAEEEEEDNMKSSKDIDEFTGLRKTSSILKRKKYDKTFGKFPPKTFSASHQNVESNNFDYVKNPAKRDFLRNGCVSRNDYVRDSQDSDEDLRRRSLSSLYHATLCASEKDAGIDLLSSSEHSSCDLSPYTSGDFLSRELNSPHEKRVSGSPPGTIRSRSVPRTHSSTIPVSNSAAEFVAAHLQEANKRGYGRTFSNLSQKSREHLVEDLNDKFSSSLMGIPRQNTSKGIDIKPASHAIQRSPKAPSKVIPPFKNETVLKKDLVSSMSKSNLQLPVAASKTSTMHKNKSTSSIRKPLGSDIVRSGDRVSSPPRSQWSTKGVQNLIQNLESIQQQKVQNVSLYQTAPSELHFSSSSPRCQGEKANDLGRVENEVRSNEDNLANDNLGAGPIEANLPPSQEDPWNNNVDFNNYYQPSSEPPPQEFGDPCSNNNAVANDYNDGKMDENVPFNNNEHWTSTNDQGSYLNQVQEPPPMNPYQWNAGPSPMDLPSENMNQFPNAQEEPLVTNQPNPYQWNCGGPHEDPPGGGAALYSNAQEMNIQDPFGGGMGEIQSNEGPSGQNNNNLELMNTQEGSSLWATAANEEPPPVDNQNICNNNNLWGNDDANLTQLNPGEVNNNVNEAPSNEEGPSSQEASLSTATSTPHQSPILNSKQTSPSQKSKSQAFVLRTSTPNDYKSHQVHRTLQCAYSTAMAKALEEEDEEEGSGSSECWNTADGDLINLQEDAGIKSSAMVMQMDKKLSRRSNQKQGGGDLDTKREQNNVTFNSEVLEISNSVSAYTQTPNVEVLSSRRVSASSSFLSQEDTEDLYCDDELNPSLENDPNMQLTISRLQAAAQEDYPSNPMFNDQDSILSMDIPSTGPTSLRSELSEDKDNYNTASSSSSEEEDGEEDNSVSVRSATPTNTTLTSTIED